MQHEHVIPLNRNKVRKLLKKTSLVIYFSGTISFDFTHFLKYL